MECDSDSSMADNGELGFSGIATLDQCEEKCNGVSELFAFGTNDYGNPRCSGDGCSCLCETAAKDGSCKITGHHGFRLYISAG